MTTARAGALRRHGWLPSLLLAMAVLSPVSAEEVADQTGFGPGDHLLRMPSLAITFARLKVEIGEIRRGRQEVEIVAIGANVGEEDYEAELTVILLDAGGGEISRQTDREGIEEGQVGKVKMEFDLDSGRVAEIASVRVEARISED